MKAPAPLELATDARVACVLLEDEIDGRTVKGKRARARLRKLWDAIAAMSDLIESQQAEIERLQLPGEVAVVVVDRPETARSVSEERVRPAARGRSVEIPAEVEAPTFVAETICEKPARKILDLPLGHRPPGFLAVRERMKRKPPRRESIEAIKAAKDEKIRTRSTPRLVLPGIEVKKPRKPVWKRLVEAIDENKLPIEKEVRVRDLAETIETTTAYLYQLSLDLSINRTAYRLRFDEHERHRHCRIERVSAPVEAEGVRVDPA